MVLREHSRRITTLVISYCHYKTDNMKYLLLLPFLLACREDIELIEPVCNFDLTEAEDDVRLYIYSEKPQVEIKYSFGEYWVEKTITSHYYNCIWIARTETPMEFVMDGCSKFI